MMKKNTELFKKSAVVILSFVLMFGSSITIFAQEESDESLTDPVSPVEQVDTEDTSKMSDAEKMLVKEKLKREKKQAKDRARELEDKFLGVVYVPEKKYSIDTGSLKLEFNGRAGSFNILARDEKNRLHPLLSQFQASDSTAFFAKIGEVSYQLNKASAVKKELRRLNSGVQLAYTVDKKAQVVLDFTTVASVLGTPDDMVKISVYSTNLTETPMELTLKAVFDTILGEGSDHHFITTAGTYYDGDRQLTSMRKDRSIISTNGVTSVQFLLDGFTIQSPEFVSFSNITSLLKGPWVPVVENNRSFNNITAYNNSALGVNWPVQKIKSGETVSFCFYIASGVDKKMPNGLAFIDSLEDEKNKAEVYVEEINKKEVELKKPEVDFVLPPVTDKQLDPVYIQNLINRINALQSDPETVDRQEVRMLNAELDAIMEKIRQQ